MPQGKANRDSITVGGREYKSGQLVDVENEAEYRNLLASGKIVAANIDAKLAQAGDTLSEQAEVNLAEAKGVMAGPVVASENAEAEPEPAKAKKLTAKSAPKKANK